MSEQLFADSVVSGFDGEGCDRPAKTGLARFLPDSTTWVTLVSVISFAILTTGCVSTAGIDAKSVPTPIEAQWWKAFADPQLDALVDRALAASPSPDLARDRIERAAAQTVVFDAGRRDAVLPPPDEAPPRPGAHNQPALAAAGPGAAVAAPR